ncbi:MAG TPA: hypothetical protein VD997_00260 [Phycisphaerales bacterium]|nr:hypothetical protein [Phycisphaerales bacterium]
MDPHEQPPASSGGDGSQQPQPGGAREPDWLDALPERATYKAQWMATRLPAEQAAWLAELRRVMGEFPNAEDFIRHAQELMRATQVKMDADVRAAHTGEQLEATASTLLDAVMSGEEELPEHPWQRAMMLLFLTSTSHKFAYLRERMSEEDVQAFLDRHIGELFRLGREEEGESFEGGGGE